jgi:transmembrane sensor
MGDAVMSNNGQHIEEPILHAAADWWLRLREPELADETMHQWLAWTEQDPRHLEAFERMNALAAEVGTLDQAGRREFTREFLPAAASKAAARRRWLPLAAAAGLAAAVLGGYLAWSLAARSVVSQSYASAVAQNRDIVLPDGSRVALGGASRMALRFSGERRQVELSEGEAFFEVVHDSAKPFVVKVGAVTVRDVGTAFDVRRTGERVSIAVTEGRVQIAAGPGSADMLEAVAGQQVAYDPATASMRVSPLVPGQATAWRDDRLAFDDEPLSVVVANLNRYSPRPVRIADAGLERLAFTGTIKLESIDRWLDALPQVLPVQVSARRDEVVLSRARK